MSPVGASCAPLPCRGAKVFVSACSQWTSCLSFPLVAGARDHVPVMVGLWLSTKAALVQGSQVYKDLPAYHYCVIGAFVVSSSFGLWYASPFEIPVVWTWIQSYDLLELMWIEDCLGGLAVPRQDGPSTDELS